MAETLDVAVLAELREAVGDDPEFVDASWSTPTSPRPRASSRRSTPPSPPGDAAALLIPAHTLKGNSTTMGAMQLAEIARSLEERARGGSIDGGGRRRRGGRGRARPRRGGAGEPHAPRGGSRERARRAAAGGRRRRDAGARPGRVLVVDDSRLNRQTLARLLGHASGHDVVEAEDGRVALDLLGDGRRRDRRRAAGPRDARARRLRGARRDPREPGLARIPVIVGLGPGRPRRDRPVRRDGRRRLPAPPDQADAPPGPRRDVARGEAAARRQRPAPRDGRAPAPGAVAVPVAAGRRARVHRPTASGCSPAIGAR